MDWPFLEQLEADHGDAFYLLDLPAFRRNFNGFLSAFRAIYANTSLGYSYKTNYVPQLCRAAFDQGAYAEVVSSLEYDLALRLGIPADRIIFNGPAKENSYLEKALLAGSLVNVDSLEETETAVQCLKSHDDRPFGVGVRCNFSVGDTPRSRFGIDIENGDIQTAVSQLRALDHVTVAGLHCHFSWDRSAAAFAQRAEKMSELCDRLFPHDPPGFVDIGGGFCGPMEDDLKAQFSYQVPTFDEYAEAVAPRFAERFGSHSQVELILEPGMGLISDVMNFVCRIASTKDIGGRHHAITTGSIYNIKPTLNKLNLPLRVVHQPMKGRPSAAGWDVSGYTCMEIDIMYRDYLGSLRTGDYLIFSNVGAYTVVLQPPFIKAAPAILSIDDEGGVEVVRRAETLADVLATYGEQISRPD